MAATFEGMLAVIGIFLFFILMYYLNPTDSTRVICPNCLYLWNMRSPHSTKNPPSQCPRCRKKLLIPPYYHTLERNDEVDDSLNNFLTNRNMQGEIKANHPDIQKVKKIIDNRIQQRNLNIRTFLNNGKIMISKY